MKLKPKPTTNRQSDEEIVVTKDTPLETVFLKS